MATIYTVTLRFHATGHERTYTYDSMLERALAIISAGGYADVVSETVTTDREENNADVSDYRG